MGAQARYATGRARRTTRWRTTRSEHRVRALILENLRELRYPASREEVTSEAGRQRLGPQLLALLGRTPDREYVSVEDVADEAGTPR